ncbi:hypothetical protein PG996_007910 [Apiospora saccharicola]|uniref:Uncharacterized protein n=1 Tax=Apiospora saccharicola TaxID=335842 RepID=A0ABR1UZN5_9PEZI
MAIKPTKTALVTGCSEGGLGFAIVQEFQARGVHVFATARSPAKVAALKGLPNVTVLALDVTSEASIQEAVRAFAPLVIEGSIANLASISGLVRPPYMDVYAGSKSAVEAISESLRHELQPFGVKVLTVIVGAIKTNIFNNRPEYELPQGSRYEPVRKEVAARIAGSDVEGRLGKPEDFAKSLVRDMMGGVSGTIRRGNMSSFVRFATAVFPRFILVSIVVGVGKTP